MADIRIKDLATTASSTAADDFLAVDGTTNGTRKLSAATPSFATSVTVPGVAGPTATDLTLAGGSTGASLVLGQGVNGSASITPAGTGRTSILSTEFQFGSSRKLVGLFNSTLSQLQSKTAADAVAPLILQPDGSNLLIGTTTDSGNGKLQLATHTTSAGGIGFGTDNQLFRYSSVQLALTNSSGTSGSAIASNMQLRVENSGNGGIQLNVPDASTGGVYFGRSTDAYYTAIERSGTNLQLRNAGATALTISSTGAATFAGAVTTGSTLTVGANIEMPASSSIRFNSGTGLIYTGGYSYALSLQGSQLNLNTLSNAPITTGTGLATFAGAVTAGGNFTLSAINSEAKATATNSSGGTDAFTVGLYSPFYSNYLSKIVFNNESFNRGNIEFFTGDSGITKYMTLSRAGALSLASTTPSTGAGSGALQVAGGIYSGAASVFGGQILSSANAANSENFGNFVASNATLNAFVLYTSGASTDQKYWGWQSGNAVGDGVIRLRALNDNATNGKNAIVIKRTGISSVIVNLPSLPTSSAGLASGDLWNDSGTVKVV